MRISLLAAAALLRGSAAQGIPGECDDAEIDCVYNYINPSGAMYTYNFATLCNDATDYTYNDTTGHSYFWNICGYANKKCLPAYQERYVYGTAVQSYGSPPPCDMNDNSTMCFNYLTNAYECCTEPCEVLGTGIPIWSVMNPNNPMTGGIQVTYYGVPAGADNPAGQCPNDTDTGSPRNRQVTFKLLCRGIELGGFQVINVSEPNPCQYEIVAETQHACGCSPACARLGAPNRICGLDGCGGYCSGPDLAGECPSVYYGGGPSPIWMPTTCNYTSGFCCRQDCNNRNCGDDGCGGSCGTCGSTEFCSQSQVCVMAVTPGPVFDIQYTSLGAGLAGGYVGGLATAFVCAAMGYFFLGGGLARFDKWRFAGDSTGSLLKPKAGAAGAPLGGASSYGGYGGVGAGAAAAPAAAANPF